MVDMGFIHIKIHPVYFTVLCLDECVSLCNLWGFVLTVVINIQHEPETWADGLLQVSLYPQPYQLLQRTRNRECEGADMAAAGKELAV